MALFQNDTSSRALYWDEYYQLTDYEEKDWTDLSEE